MRMDHVQDKDRNYGTKTVATSRALRVGARVYF